MPCESATQRQLTDELTAAVCGATIEIAEKPFVYGGARDGDESHCSRRPRSSGPFVMEMLTSVLHPHSTMATPLPSKRETAVDKIWMQNQFRNIRS